MSTTLASLHDSFQRDLRAERRSVNTRQIYGESVQQFITWLDTNGQPTTLDGLTRTAIRGWLAELSETRSAGTAATRFRSLRRFVRWLEAEGEIDSNPMTGMGQPKEPVKPVPVLDDDQLGALIKACQGKEFGQRTDEVIVRILLDCGIRVSELVGLRVNDVDLDQGSALVRGKGDKVRAIYFSARTVRAIDRYLRLRSAQRWASAEALLIGQRGPMSDETVRRRVRDLGDRVGIADLHPHVFRHTFAADFLQAGGQERDLKRLAGWSSDRMLERYGAATADSRARAAAQRLGRGDRV